MTVPRWPWRIPVYTLAQTKDRHICQSLFVPIRPSMQDNGSRWAQNGCNNRVEIDFPRSYKAFRNRVEWINRERKKRFHRACPIIIGARASSIPRSNLGNAHAPSRPKKIRPPYISPGTPIKIYCRKWDFTRTRPTNFYPRSSLFEASK